MYCIISAKTGRLATSALFETREQAAEFAEQNIGIEYAILRTEYDEQAHVFNQVNQEEDERGASDQWKEDFGGEDDSQ